MVKLNIDNCNSVCDNFLGNNAIYHGYAGLLDNAGREYTEEECEIEADRAAKMGLKIARTFYGYLAYDFENNRWDYENKKIKPFYRWLKRMKDRGISVALHAGWCNPGDFYSSTWTGPSPCADEDFVKSVDNFAKYVSRNLHELVEVRGFTNIKYLMLFTEPQNKAGSLPEGMTVYDSYYAVTKAVHEQLIKDGRRHLVKLVGPNEGSTTTNDMLKWASKNIDYLDCYSSHNYQTSFELNKDDAHSGDRVCLINIPGGRCFQYVTLKPNTEYTVSCYLKMNSENPVDISGYAIYGAFNVKDKTINSGNEPTNRLTLQSTEMIQLSEIEESYNKFTFTFNSENNTEAIIGLFLDCKGRKCDLYVDDFALTEKDSTENLLKNSSFENPNEAWELKASSNASSDSYYEWLNWGRNAKAVAPKDKMFWFDEYNFISDTRFYDKYFSARQSAATIGLMNSGCNTSLMWTAFDQQWPNSHTNNDDGFYDGDHRHGVMPTLKRSLVPYPCFYTYSLMSRYFGGENSKVFEGFGENNIQCTMNIMADGNISIAVVSTNKEDAEFELKFAKELDNVTLYRHIYNPKTIEPDEKCEVIKADKEINVNGFIKDTIPSFSLIVYTTYKD